jgi:hypothetical protein
MSCGRTVQPWLLDRTYCAIVRLFAERFRHLPAASFEGIVTLRLQ